jgi:3-oxoacyl-[acyl-carrier protein] reductase
VRTEGRVVLVTGAARGLPRGIAMSLASGGYRVAFTYRPGGTSPQATEDALRACDVSCLAIASDAGVAGDTERAVREAERCFGRVDAFVHAVGPIIVKRFARTDLADYRTMVDANLTSAVEGALALLPGMRKRRFGRFVYFGMNGSHVTAPVRDMALYAAAKAGVVTFARTLALEEAEHGISVNVIEPGDIRRKYLGRAAASAVRAENPTGRAGSWEDIAYAVRFFLADEASFINGAVLGVNGGLFAPYETPPRASFD